MTEKNLIDDELVTSFKELADIFDIEIDNKDEDDESLSALEKAIDRGSVFHRDTDDGPLLIVELKKPIMMLSGEKGQVIEFRSLRGSDRKDLMNSKDGKRGDSIYKIIARRTKISTKGLDTHNSKDVGLLESIFTFFL